MQKYSPDAKNVAPSLNQTQGKQNQKPRKITMLMKCTINISLVMEMGNIASFVMSSKSPGPIPPGWVTPIRHPRAAGGAPTVAVTGSKETTTNT